MSEKPAIKIKTLKNTGKLPYLLLVLMLLVNVPLIYGQKNTVKLKFGVYGIYSEPELIGKHSIWDGFYYVSHYSKPWQELKITETGTFTFYEKYDDGIIREYNGKWKIKKDKIIFYAFKNDKSRPIPTKFYIRENQLCDSRKSELCYEWQEKSKQ